MADIANLAVSLDLDSDRFSYGLSQAGGELNKFGRQLDGTSSSSARTERQIQGLNEQLRSLKNAAAGFVGIRLFADGFGSLVTAQKQLQQIHYGFVGALGSAQAASEAFAYVSEVSDRLGLSLQSAASEFTKITASATAMGVSMEQQKRLFEGLARSATVMHLSTDQVKFATMALSQMFGKGKIQAEELRRQLGEHIPGVVPRFQKAVLKAVEGTDLAGNSFDQLLQKGALTTDKFLPQLIESLEETGRGAEVAAQGLNANLNRLSTAWFKWKADTTEGLFNDAVIAGSRLLANNLNLIANSATAVALAFAGIKVSNLFGGAVAAGQQKITDIKMQSSATKDLLRVQGLRATQSLQNAKADLQQAESTSKVLKGNVDRAKAAARLADAERAQAEVAVKSAQRQIAAQEALIQKTRRGKQRGARGIIEQAEVELARQKEILAKAERRLTQETLKRNTAMGTQSSLNKTIYQQELQVAAAKNAVAAAEARAASIAGREATLTFFNRMKTSLTGLGQAALSLVGGTWGAALIAIGGLVYGVHKWQDGARKADEAWLAHTETMKNISMTADDVILSLSRMGKAADMRHSLNSWFDLQKGISDSAKELDKLERKKARWDAMQDANYTAGGTMGAMGGSAMFTDRTNDIKRAAERMSQLREATSEYSRQLQEMEPHLKRALPPGLFDQLVKKARELNAEDFQKFINSLDLASQRAINLGIETSNALSKIRESFANRLWDIQVQTLRAGKDGAYRAALADMAKEHMDAFKVNRFTEAWALMGPDQQRDFVKQREMIRAALADLEAANALKKESANITKEEESEQKKALQTLASMSERIRRQNEVNSEFLNTGEKMNASARLATTLEGQLASIRKHLTAQTVQQMEASIAALRLQGDEVEMKEKQIAAESSMLRLREELDNRVQLAKQSNADELLNLGRGDKAAEQARRMIALRREYNREVQRINRDDSISDETRNAELALLRDRYDTLESMEREHQRRMAAERSNWTHGVRKAWEDFRDASLDVSSAMASVAQSAFTGFVDLVTEALTTGKASFTDFATHILTELTRILASKALAQLADVLLGMFNFGGSVGGGSGSGGGSGGGNTGSKSAAASNHKFANGGVMTGEGVLPLRKYALGGVARSPQVAIFGEGRLPEAYVPLPDGRSIPVTMEGGSGGGMINNTNIAVYTGGDRERRQESGDAGREGRQLGKLIEGAVKDIMVREMRQGGLLWRMQHAA